MPILKRGHVIPAHTHTQHTILRNQENPHSLGEDIDVCIMQQFFFCFVFSSPVRKYRKSYCSHPGVGVCVRVAQMLKFLIKVFISLYLLNMLMDQVDTLHGGRYWSEVLCCTIMTHLGDLEVKVTDLEILR